MLWSLTNKYFLAIMKINLASHFSYFPALDLALKCYHHNCSYHLTLEFLLCCVYSPGLQNSVPKFLVWSQTWNHFVRRVKDLRVQTCWQWIHLYPTYCWWSQRHWQQGVTNVIWDEVLSSPRRCTSCHRSHIWNF